MIELVHGDITKMEVDAIVNAANSALKGGGGVDGAIHRAGGPEILQECRSWVDENGKLPTGDAMLTTAGDLPAKHVIHTVGPVWKDGTANEDQLLANCYINSLKLCEDKGFESVAFPNISTGVYGYPKEDAAEVAVATVKNFLNSMQRHLAVHFVCFDEENHAIYKRLLE